MSMGDAASTVDGFRLLTDTTYSNWDAEMVFGCVCDLGFFGYDCSLRTCPTGDDPLTFGQADEEQLLDCTCDTCSGYFVLTFRGSTTSRIAHNAVMTIADEDPDVRTTGIGAGESLEAKLQALRTVTGVTVTSTDASVCSSGGTTTTITFTQNGGDVPELEVSSFLSGSATPTLAISHGRCLCCVLCCVVLWCCVVLCCGVVFCVIIVTRCPHFLCTHPSGGTGASFDGTTEDAVCSNRGICDESRGICTCFENFEASNGESSQGDIPDCGAQTPLSLITDCPSAFLENKFDVLTVAHNPPPPFPYIFFFIAVAASIPTLKAVFVAIRSRLVVFCRRKCGGLLSMASFTLRTGTRRRAHWPASTPTTPPPSKAACRPWTL